MNKPCARCNKTVYPTEKLNCLDKIWHKLCFKCEVCGMTLNMKTYKGFDKKPYCNAHCPTAKATVVADTPENRRLMANTKKQSLLEYHKDFETQKGHMTSVTDDPETLRNRHVQNTVSQVKYHGVEQNRAMQEAHRASVGDVHEGGMYTPQPQQSYNPPPPQQPPQYNPSPYSARTQAATTVYDSQQGGRVEPASTRKVGSITDYDPANDQWGSGAGAGAPPPQQQSAPYSPPPQQSYQAPPQQSYQPPPQPSYQPPPPAAPAAADPGPKWVAMYDYTAADGDEVSFMEGDVILDGEIIDAGWMTGRVQRTGQSGMLPSNYVERA